MDRITKEHRSWNMSRIRSADTQPERIVCSILQRMGLRIRLGERSVPGTPDAVLPRLNVALFVHGCFWHRHRRCTFAYTPRSRLRFWSAKFRENVRRDKRVQGQLRKAGWTPVVVWECHTGNMFHLSCTLANRLRRIAMKKDRKTSPIIPALPSEPTVPQVRRWLGVVIRAVGPGFHPDTDPADYLDLEHGTRLFSRRQAACLRRWLGVAERTLARSRCDIYTACAPIQRRLLRSATSGLS